MYLSIGENGKNLLIYSIVFIAFTVEEWEDRGMHFLFMIASFLAHADMHRLHISEMRLFSLGVRDWATIVEHPCAASKATMEAFTRWPTSQ